MSLSISKILQVNNLCHTFVINRAKIPILTNITFSVQKGEIFGIMGQSGSGKTTLLKLLNGFLPLENNSRHFLKKSFLHNQSGMIFQNFNLLNNLTVFDNVALPLKIRHQEPCLIEREVNQMLTFVGLKPFANVYPKMISGGQKQRVAIARALVYKPKIIFCDEPTSALDTSTRREILQLLLKTNQLFNTTIVLVSHDDTIIKHLCHRVAILNQGKLIKITKLSPSYDFSTISYDQLF